eukprot:TRINITY_DN10749_c0_g1_i2.p1 TRINITY_DN10749_c0_g1~~TRINITY_DN10749_c0_g1_i2.p1  ORF type:complete len:216 (+),score=49.13 TRINITY_DN10749_c0_g1_i2:35-682(+)
MSQFVEWRSEAGDRLFVRAEFQSTEDVSLLIFTEDGISYNGSINQGTRDLMAKNLKKTPAVITEYIEGAFKTGDIDDGNMMFDVKESQLIWRKLIGARKMKLLLAKIPLTEAADTESNVRDFLADGIRTLNSALRDSLSLSALAGSREGSLRLTESLKQRMMQGMESYEGDLQERFLRILNEQQDVNKRLLRKMNGEDVVMDGDYDADTDVEETA